MVPHVARNRDRRRQSGAEDRAGDVREEGTGDCKPKQQIHLAPSHPIATIVVAVSIHSLQRAQKSPRQTEWFQLGHAQAVLAGYAKTVNEQWPELLATKYHVLALQFDRRLIPAIATLRRLARHRRESFRQHLLAHVAPLGWEHIGLTGDYVWTEANPAAPFRPLREVRSMFQPHAA